MTLKPKSFYPLLLGILLIFVGCESVIPDLEVSPFDPVSTEDIITIMDISYRPNHPPLNTPAVVVEYELSPVAEANEDKIKFYAVFKDGEVLNVRSATSGPLVDRDIQSGQSYSYQVGLVNFNDEYSKLTEAVVVDVP